MSGGSASNVLLNRVTPIPISLYLILPSSSFSSKCVPVLYNKFALWVGYSRLVVLVSSVKFDVLSFSTTAFPATFPVFSRWLTRLHKFSSTGFICVKFE